MKIRPPIPSPFSAPESEPETLSFKVAALPIFFASCVIPVPCVAILFVPLIIAKRISFAPIMVVLIIEAIFALIMAHICRVVVSPNSVRGQNFWGAPTELQWDEIISAQKANFLGLKYLKLSSSTKKNVIWLPLYLSDRPGFVQAVAKFAEADNPLRQQLSQIFSNNAR